MESFQAYNAILQAGSRPLYQLAVFVSMVAGGFLIRRDSRNWPLSLSVRCTIIAAAAIGSLVGCAVPAFFAGGYVSSLTSDLLLSPKTILGGMLIGFFAVALAKRVMGVAYDTSDAFARGGCLMMGIGRLGCVAQHCCFGKPTAGPLGVDFGDGVARVPVQAIEASCVFLLFVAIHFCHQRDWFRNRRLFILFATYGVLRFGLEFARADVGGQLLGIGFYQWIALSLFLVGSFQITRRTRKLRDASTTLIRAAEVTA